MRILLGAQEVRPLSLQGGYFYYEQGADAIEVKTVGGDARRFELNVGQGFRFDKPLRFESLEIKNLSDEEQEISFKVSDSEIFDNRATIASTSEALRVNVVGGSIDIDGLLSIVNQGGLYVENSKLPLVAGVAKKVMAADVARMKASLYFDVAVSLGKDATVTVATGYPLTAGSDWTHENVGELWAISASGGNVYIIEDKK